MAMDPARGTFFGVSFPSNAAMAAVGRAFQQVIAGFPGQKIYFNDNLFTVGHASGFLEDPAFMAAVERQKPDNVEEAILWRTHTMVWAARTALRQVGDFVECGCYRGYTSAVICDLLDWKAAGRAFWLYDLFNPSGAEGEGKPMLAHHGGLHQQVVARFAHLANVRVIQGRVPDSFAQGAPDRIALLHIDMNNADAEVGALEVLFDRVVPGGVIVLDDYGWEVYRNQRLAHDAFMAARGYSVLELPTGQGMVVK